MRSGGPKRNKMEPDGIAGGQEEIIAGCPGFLTPSCPGPGLSPALTPLLNISHNGRRNKVPRETARRHRAGSAGWHYGPWVGCVPSARLTVSVGVIQSHDRRAGSQQRLLQGAGGDVPGVQLVAPFLLLLLRLRAVSIPGPRLAVAHARSACGSSG